MKKILSVLSLAMLLAPAISQADVFLGQATLGNRDRVQPINLRNTCGIKKLRLQVMGDRAEIDYVLVDYVASGARQTLLPVEKTLGRGQSTNVDLPGNVRCVDKIYLIGRSIGSPRPSLVAVYGIEAQNNVRIAQVQLSNRGNIRSVDVPNICRIGEVKLKVEGDGAQIDFIAVQFTRSGDWHQIPVRDHFAQGSESNWKQLPGRNDRCISKVYVAGQSDRGDGKTRVILVGR